MRLIIALGTLRIKEMDLLARKAPGPLLDGAIDWSFTSTERRSFQLNYRYGFSNLGFLRERICETEPTK